MKKSDVGKEPLDYIIDKNIDVQVNYNPEITYPNLMGLSYGKHIDIYGLNVKTKKEAVKTIIHETTHIKYNVIGDQWSEAFCEIKAMQHEKQELTISDIKDIIRDVKKNYPEYKWRNKNGNK